MVEKKLVITCNKCGSKDVKAEEKYYGRQYRRVKDAGTLDREYLSLKSIKKKLLCHCNKCCNNFEEELGTEIFDLLPEEIEV